MDGEYARRIGDYAVSCLQEELFYARRRDEEIDKFTRFAYRKLKEAYWTFTRYVGLGFLHDGSRRPPERKKSERPRLMLASRPSPHNPRVLIDVTGAHHLNITSGIQRVARELAKAAAESGDGLPVIIQDGRLISYFQGPFFPETVDVREGDTLLMPDATWGREDKYLRLMEEISRRGGKNVICVHDLLPLDFPVFFDRDHVRLFANWFERMVVPSDAVVAVSKSVADHFCEYVQARGLAWNKPVGWVHLGCDFHAPSNTRTSTEALAICADKTPFFLSVGTLDPRKGYPIALAAFERLWNLGVNVRYVITGTKGSQTNALAHRILNHPEYGRRLFWLEQASDADLVLFYKNARALIFPSVAEGFGLPLVEARGHGLAVIASDIPVFREIGGEAITYFDLLDADCLAQRVAEALASHKSTLAVAPRTWREATEELLEMVRHGRYQFQPTHLAWTKRQAGGLRAS